MPSIRYPFARRALLVLGLLATTLVAGADEPRSLKLPALFGEPTIPGTDPLGFPSLGMDRISVELVPENAVAGDEVTLRVKVSIPIGSHTYSMNPSFSGRTAIEIKQLAGLEEITGNEWKADQKPTVVVPEGFDQEVEKLFGDVTFSKTFLAPRHATKIEVKGIVHFQICNTVCSIYHDEFTAEAVLQPRTFPYQMQAVRELTPNEPPPATLDVRLSPENARPGDEVTLEVSLSLQPGWHTFGLSSPPGIGGDPTTIRLSGFQGLSALERDFTDPATFETITLDTGKEHIVKHWFKDRVTWTRRFKVLESAESYGLSGEVTFQICNDKQCQPERAYAFRLGDLREERSIGELQTPVFSAADLKNEIEQNQNEYSFAMYLALAFFGGIALNVMPCVLPVLAIKVLSFVKQAGESRARVLQLNLAYSLGIWAVFMILASLAVGVKFGDTQLEQVGWGGLFQRVEFNIGMSCLVFAMGLSLLGVFEIPIPGLGGHGLQKEGLLGAFLTGIFATFLATPCTGPFMGVALGWSVKQPAFVTYTIWSVLALGMAFPYLLCGVFPGLLKYFPKPGTWMVRFKEFAGFALMATVVWLISSLPYEYIVPALTMMLGLAIGLWMIGSFYDVTSAAKLKNTVRITATLTTATIIAFGLWLMPGDLGADPSTATPSVATSTDIASAPPPMARSMSPREAPAQRTDSYRPQSISGHELPWKPFSEQALVDALEQQRTVLVDFTAAWCLNCKWNEHNALNTEKTLDFVRGNDVVTLYADFTREDPVIKDWLSRFNANGVPLTVVFPGNNPKGAIALHGIYREGTLLEKLEEAVKGTGAAQLPTSASGN